MLRRLFRCKQSKNHKEMYKESRSTINDGAQKLQSQVTFFFRDETSGEIVPRAPSATKKLGESVRKLGLASFALTKASKPSAELHNDVPLSSRSPFSLLLPLSQSAMEMF